LLAKSVNLMGIVVINILASTENALARETLLIHA